MSKNRAEEKIKLIVRRLKDCPYISEASYSYSGTIFKVTLIFYFRAHPKGRQKLILEVNEIDLIESTESTDDTAKSMWTRGMKKLGW